MKVLIQKLLAVFAKAVLKKYHPDVIGITGSIGKTSVKEALASILKIHFTIFWSSKSFNNEIGVPLTILGIQESPGKSLWAWIVIFLKASWLLIGTRKWYPSIIICEMGADAKGNINYLTTLAPCRVGVLTALSPTHIEKFGSLEELIQEKKIIVRHLKGEYACAVLNADDGRILEEKEIVSVPVITYGFHSEVDIRVSEVEESYVWRAGEWKGIVRGNISFFGKKHHFEFTRIIGRHSLSSLLAACSVGYFYRIPTESILEQLIYHDPIQGRMRGIKGIKNSFIIDDSYNSSPRALMAALETFSHIDIDEQARRILILGDMLELGSLSKEEHEKAGEQVAKMQIDFLMCIGKEAQIIASTAREHGLDPAKIHWFNTSQECGKRMKEIIRKGDLFLIKGSQGVRLERIVKLLMAEPEHAKELLVRQGKEWR